MVGPLNGPCHQTIMILNAIRLRVNVKFELVIESMMAIIFEIDVRKWCDNGCIIVTVCKLSPDMITTPIFS